MTQAEWGWWFGMKVCEHCGIRLVAMPTEKQITFVCPNCDVQHYNDTGVN